MSDRLRGRQGDYRRALADPVRFDVAFYAGLYVETLEAEVERLRAVRRALVRDNRDKTAIIRELKAALAGMVALMERSDGVASIAHGPNGYEVGCIEWGWYEEVKAVKAALAAVSAETEADA